MVLVSTAARGQALAVAVRLRHAVLVHVLAKVGKGSGAVQDVAVVADHRHALRRPRHAVALGRGRRVFAAGLRRAVVQFGGVNAALM